MIENIRTGVVGIVIQGDKNIVLKIQEILSEYSDIIQGRMGVPNHENNINIISLIVKGSMEKISALTGKIGRIGNVNVKSALSSI